MKTIHYPASASQAPARTEERTKVQSHNERKQRSLLSLFLEDEDLQVRSRADFFYATAVFFLIAGFLCPLFFIGSAICTLLAKRGGAE